MMHFALLLASLQGVTVDLSVTAPGDTLVLRPDSAAIATAYEDENARELVRRARGQRGVIDASVFHYSATARQRLSVGVRALRRDRILYRREGASTIEWWRDRPGRVTVHAARQAVPVALPGIQVPDDLDDWARSFVPEPGDDRLWVNPTGAGFAWHPLIEGGEALYTYATGDTTRIRLPDGREVRLVELRVTPREREFRVVVGSLWIELENHAVVQAVFRPAREFDLERDLTAFDPDAADDGDDGDDADDIPGFLKPIRFDVRYVTTEYALWEMRWWMPRMMAFEGYLEMGGVRMPITMEIVYSDYSVEADPRGLPALPPVIFHLAGDPYAEPRRHVQPIRVVVPADSATLLESPYLPGSFFSDDEGIVSEADIRVLDERLGDLPPVPWEVGLPTVTAPWTLGQELVRYNRVEGLSAGARVDWDLTRFRVDLTARLGVADLEPRAELGVEVPSRRWHWRLAGYHRLAAVDPRIQPFSLGNSLNALLFGRDDGMYYQASGAEVRVSGEGGGRNRLRVYVEHQVAVDRHTHWSLPYLGGSDGFRENIRADEADQIGAAARLGIDRGLDPTGFRWGASLDLTAETGSFTFVRPGITLHGAAPLPMGLMGAMEVGGGTSLSPDSGIASAPLQSHWLLGGPATLRGFNGGELAGRDYLRGRLEVANRFPAARIAIFTDGGWVGRFDGLDVDDVAVSVGVGASFLDGLVRFDLARAIRPVERWRAELYLDALF